MIAASQVYFPLLVTTPCICPSCTMRSVTDSSKCNVPPNLRYVSINALRTSKALSDSGNTLPPRSTFVGTPHECNI